MRWSYRIIRIAGTDVKMHVTFLLLLAFRALGGYQEGGTSGLATELVFTTGIFLCIVLHEFGHIFMARRFGIRTPDVILLPIGGVARLERMPSEPRQEFLIALAGPAVTLGIAAVLYGYLRAWGLHPPLLSLELDGRSITTALMQVNVFLLLFNLIPAFPMDGGRVLRSLLAMRLGLLPATRIAARIGQTLAIVAGVYGFQSHATMLVLIAIFVFLGAGTELNAVELRAARTGDGR
ncbi:MAG TPA: site-2 protease family protein [Gemmatimonadales bacterium]|jgi:Zn-dependent protease|nr:site-2 protease family protein [Gemmatimonadales bacterium]